MLAYVKLLATTLAIAVLLNACSGNDATPAPAADGSSPRTATVAAKAPKLSDAQLTAALLTPADLGGTWALATPTPTRTATPTPTPAVTSADSGCASLDRLMRQRGDDAPNDKKPLAKAKREFIASPTSTFGPFLQQELALAPSEREARENFSQLARAMGDCKVLRSIDENGTATEFTVERVDLKGAGDDSLALRLGTSTGSILGALALEYDMLVTRRADLTSLITWLGINVKAAPEFLQRVLEAVDAHSKELLK